MKNSAPSKADITTVNCFCDYCGKSLDKLESVWIWNEHFACSRDHVQRAQAKTNGAYKHVILEKKFESDGSGTYTAKIKAEELSGTGSLEIRDIDLL